MLLLFVIFYLLGGIYFISIMSLIGILAYKEIIFLKKYPPIVMFIGLFCIISLILSNSFGFNYISGVNYPSIIGTIIFLILPSLLPKHQKSYTMDDAFGLIGMILFVGIALGSINQIMLSNRYLLLYIISITALNDIFAYLVGVSIGKHKFSKISPKKSIEGLIGGNIAGIVGGIIIHLILIPNSIDFFSLLILTIILSISGQLGDLIFSKIKREKQIKDFSNLIPGHGGILDRLDSVLFTSLMYLFITSIF